MSAGLDQRRRADSRRNEPRILEAALRSSRSSASDTVREVHRAVLAAGAGGNLADDATAVCLAAG